MHVLSRIFLALLAAAAGPAVWAQAFPAKPVRIIVAFPAGGGTDIVARTISPRLGEYLGQQVVIDNRAGAGGLVGTEIAAKASPDGYTIFMGTLGNLSVNPLLYKKLPFDIHRDFAPLTQVVSVSFMLVVHPSFPVKTVRDLINIAKSKPGQINYASSGNGGAPHLSAELFNSLAKVKMIHVPYKGSGPSFTAVLGGEIPLTFDSMVQGLPYVKSGRLRAVAVLGPKRSPLLPEVPAVAETLPGYEVVNWFGMVVPAATPRDIVNRLHAEAVKTLRLPEIRERLMESGAEPVGSSPEEFGTFMKAETAKWAKVIKEANIHAD
ncbi:MAG TPA: tripartite tricarboxylate transporter substrate binding protein [Burkholderiales bacterium]|nr:tripartite tricarboxylate transporter substrate binding protein [Burkholderiales bacterium]